MERSGAITPVDRWCILTSVSCSSRSSICVDRAADDSFVDVDQEERVNVLRNWSERVGQEWPQSVVPKMR